MSETLTFDQVAAMVKELEDARPTIVCRSRTFLMEKFPLFIGAGFNVVESEHVGADVVYVIQSETGRQRQFDADMRRNLRIDTEPLRYDVPWSPNHPMAKDWAL